MADKIRHWFIPWKNQIIKSICACTRTLRMTFNYLKMNLKFADILTGF